MFFPPKVRSVPPDEWDKKEARFMSILFWTVIPLSIGGAVLTLATVLWFLIHPPHGIFVP
ncbi:MAG: hypothetical protein RLZZ342_622 [Candidatus Parcubacteria bacterium]|jgi:hypothetical protein